jgi:hypothetical protein
MGIEPTPPAWKAGALPLSYARDLHPSQRHSDRGPGSIRHANVSLRRLTSPFPTPTHLGSHNFFAGSHGPLAPLVGLQGSPAAFIRSHGSPAVQWGKKDSNLRRLCHQIYSLAPLTAREFPPTTAVTNFQRTDRRSMRYASLNDHKMGACWSEDRLTHPEASGGT